MEKGHDSSNRLSGHEKDKLRKKFGHNRLTGSEMDSGRKSKLKKMAKKSGKYLHTRPDTPMKKKDTLNFIKSGAGED